jgi:hypothetical protein
MKMSDLIEQPELAPQPTEQIVPAGQGPDIDSMPRADALVVFKSFADALTELREAARNIKVTSADQKDQIALARATRLDLKRLRCDVENARKQLGEEALRRKQAIDEEARTLKGAIEPLEALMLEQEEFAVREEARLAEERRVSRTALLEPLGFDCTYLSLASMPEDAFQILLSGHKLAKDQREKEAAEAIERAKKEQAEREAREKAEAEAREAQRIENERLRKEAAEREEKARIEREEAAAALKKQQAEAEAERKRIEAENARQAALVAEKNRKEREALEAKAKQEREAAEAKAREEAAARQKLQDEIDARKRKEEEEKAAKIEVERKLAAAGDKQRIIAFRDGIRAVPLMKLSNAAVHAEIADKHRQFQEWLDKKASGL